METKFESMDIATVRKYLKLKAQAMALGYNLNICEDVEKYSFEIVKIGLSAYGPQVCADPSLKFIEGFITGLEAHN